MAEYGYNLLNKTNKKYIYIHIENITGRLSNIFEVDLIKEIYNMVENLYHITNKDELIKEIDKIVDIFLPLINNKTLEFLNKHKIPLLLPKYIKN